MKVNYSKKIKGLCYTEDILDVAPKKIGKVIFNNECRLITEANQYLRELRITSIGSYNTENVIARDLCHFYNFLIVSEILIKDIDTMLLSEFVKYLKIIDRNHNNYAIENTLITKLPMAEIEKNRKILKIRDFGMISNKSIFRIIDRVINYLEYLHRNNKYFFKLDFATLKVKKAKLKLLRANNIDTKPHSVNPVTIEKTLLNEHIIRVKEIASKRNDYEKFLYFLLEKTGIRIGEALGLKISDYSLNDVKNIVSDISYDNGVWKVHVIWRGSNPTDSLVKNRSSRVVFIKSSDVFEFEMLLERYLKFRKKVLKHKECEWLLISNKGTKLSQNTAYKRFKRNIGECCPECIDNITLHSLRHTFCTNELLNGTPLEFVAKLAGHKDPKTTFDVYVHYSGEHMEEIRERYSKYMKEANEII